MKLFEIIKKIFKVEKVEDINEEMVEAYYNEMDKTEEVVEEEKTEEVVENAEPEVEETKTETEEKVEEVVEETPIVEEVVEEKVEETEEKKEEVLTKEVINSSKGSVLDTADLMNLHGKQFFDALYKNRKNLM